MTSASDSDDDTTLDVSGQHGPAVEPPIPAKVGRFSVVELIGTGGMGRVYLAHDGELDRDVAIKVLQPRLSNLPSDHDARLVREARAMARVTHPNVATVYEVSREHETVFIAMELISGEPLKTWVRHKSWREVLDVFIQAGRGLAAAHREGLVHRDFKPSNVMVTPGGVAKVLDFGLARAAGDQPVPEASEASISSTVLESATERRLLSTQLTRAGSLVGTPAYMAPEQFSGDPPDARTDQFSFCVALYEGLYGRRPFAGTDRRSIEASVISGQILPPPRKTEVPARIWEAVERGLQRNSRERWPAMEPLIGALGAGSRRRSGRAVLAAAALGVGGIIIGRGLADPTQTCEGAERNLDGIWDGARRTAVEQAILGTGVPYAAATWERVAAQLDEYTSSWVDVHTAACEATHLAGVQSGVVLDRRMVCLHRRLDDVRGIVGVLAEADRGVVVKAVETAASLRPLATCSDPDALASKLMEPTDPELARRVATLRTGLAEIKAREISGQFEDALGPAEDLLKQARETEYPPIIAESLLRVAGLKQELGDYELAEQLMSEAYWTALENRHDSVAVESAVTLVYAVGVHRARHDDGMTWGRHARSAMARLPDDAISRSALLGNEGTVLEDRARYPEALARLESALQLREKARGPMTHNIATMLGSIGNVHRNLGNHDQALGYHGRALFIRERVLGPQHPDVGSAMSNLGSSLANVGRHQEALAVHERSLAIIEQALGPNHPSTAKQIANIAVQLENLGSYRAAADYFERAASRFERLFGPEHPNLAIVFHNLGGVLRLVGDNERALAHGTRALEMFEKTFGPHDPRTGAALGNVGNTLHDLGRVEEGLDHFERSLAAHAAALGSHHPDVAVQLHNLGGALAATGRVPEAIAHHTRAIALWERTLGREHHSVAIGLTGLALALMEDRRAQEAIPLLERALVIARANEADMRADDRARVQFALARALVHAGRARPRALELAREARRGHATDGAHERALEVERWLRRHS